MDVRVRVSGEKHTDTLITKGNLARLYDAQGRFDDAERLYLDAVSGFRSLFPKGDWRTGAALYRYGAFLTGRGRYDQAEVELLESHKILEHARGADDRHSINTIRFLVELYEASNKETEAAVWRKKLPAETPLKP